MTYTREERVHCYALACAATDDLDAIERVTETLLRERAAARAERDLLKAALARVEDLCDMEHNDRLIRVGDIRAALRGKP